MAYSIKQNDKVPAYMQMYQLIKDDIINGTYPLGSKIPSKRILAADSGLSVITIKHSLELLCDEGYIEAKQRSGYFVIFAKEDFLVNAIDTQKTLPSQEESLATQTKGNFPYSVLAKTMRKVILDYEDVLLTKSPNAGCLYLRNEICSYLARSRAIHAKPNQVVIGSGAEYLYGLIAQLFGHEAGFAIENPSYNKIRKVYEAFGISCDLLTMNQDGINSEELNLTSATILHTTPFNSFPSKVTISSSKKYEYINWAKKRSGFIIEDNYDSELTVSSKPEDSLYSIAQGKNVIYTNTFSQTISPSLRIGYMILPEELLNLYNECLGFYSCTVPVFDQYVLAELLHNGDFERHINRERRKRRRLLSQS